MVDLVFFPFAIGFAAVIIILTLDTTFGARIKTRSLIGGTTSLIVHVTLLFLVWELWNSLTVGQRTVSAADSPLATSLQVNLAGLYIFGVAATLGLAATVYSLRYMANYRNAPLFHSLLVLLVVSIFGIVVSGDLLTLFIFWEGMSFCGYGLVAFRKSSWEALEASMKYLLLAGVGSLIALFGIAIVYSISGTLNLQSISALDPTATPGAMLGLGLIITGFGVEAAIAPLHTWLPDAHPAAPSPLSALLSGIVIETGSFTIVRIIAGSFLTGRIVTVLQPVFVALAGGTMLVGNLSAYYQDDLKRMLAFSSVAQVGYILLGISTFSAAGISASVFHIWNHALLKGLFFLLAGVISFSFGTRKLSEMAGVGKRWPLLGFLVSLNALAMTGIPPFGMFWSEFLILLSALSVKSSLMLSAGLVMLLNIAFSIGYYFRIIRLVAFDPRSDYMATVKMKPKSWIMIMPCIVLVGLSLITGLFPGWFYDPALRAVQSMMMHSVGG